MKIKKHLKDAKIADLQLLDILRLLEIYSKEFINEDFEKTANIAYTIINRLLYTHITSWTIFDIRISPIVINYIEKFEEVEELLEKALSAAKKHIKDKPLYKFELSLYRNVLFRLLRAGFLEVDITEESEQSKKLKTLFGTYLYRALEICQKHSKSGELRKFELMILIRSALFDRNSKMVLENLGYLKEIKGERELYNAMKREVTKYSPSFGLSLTPAQYKIMVGGRIKKFREKAGISIPDFANMMGYEETSIRKIENGTSNLPAFSLIRAAHILNVTVNDLVYETDRTYSITGSITSDEETTEIAYTVIDALLKKSKQKKLTEEEMKAMIDKANE